MRSSMNEDTFHLGIKALIRSKDGKVLLLKVNKAALKDHSGEPYWDIPGGRVQEGNTIEETLLREVEEETGINDVSGVKPISMVLSNIRIPLKDGGNVGLILAIYECTIPEEAPIILSEEHVEYKYFDPIEAAELLSIKYPKEFTDVLVSLR